MLALADGLTVLASILGVGLIYRGWLDGSMWSLFVAPLWIPLAKIYGLYDRDHRALRHLTIDELPSLVAWATTGVVMLALVLQVTPAGRPPMVAMLWLWAAAVLGGFCMRGLARAAWRRFVPRERTAVIGDGHFVEAIRRKLQIFEDIHVDLVAQREELSAADLENPPAWLLDVDRLILVSDSVDEELIGHLVSFCRRADTKLSVILSAHRMFSTAVRLKYVADLPVVEYNTWDVSRSTLMLKRCLDVAVSAVALLLFLPLCFVAAVAIRLDSEGPIFFRQERAGQHMKPFDMYKFRTMVHNAEDLLADLVPFAALKDPMFKLAQDPRVTRVGRFLRRWSIDELPQLVNVLKGDMSLVGPRPEQSDLVERYAPEHRFRLAVKPGLTGPMQVFGRGQLTFSERLAVEREYIENMSLGRDLRIVALTIPTILAGRGAF